VSPSTSRPLSPTGRRRRSCGGVARVAVRQFHSSNHCSMLTVEFSVDTIYEVTKCDPGFHRLIDTLADRRIFSNKVILLLPVDLLSYW
jgi:hypothetical protein